MNVLAAQQRALLKALWMPRPESAAALVGPFLVRADARAVRGLRAYRSNGRLLAERALAAAYPGVAETLGKDNFAGLARSHWQRFAPERGDIARWGAQLAQHIESIPPLVEDFPSLADQARVEWALHCASAAADLPAQPETLQLLADSDPAHVTLLLASATCCVAGALVWRDGLRPRTRAPAPGEQAFIDALLARRSLLAALEAAPHFDIHSWLAPAVQDGLVRGAVLL